MKPEDWAKQMIEHVVSATEVELTPDDQRYVQSLLASKNSPLMKVLIGMVIRTTPSAATLLRQDLSSPSGIQIAQRLQGKMIGVNEFLDNLFDFAAGALGETDDAA